METQVEPANPPETRHLDATAEGVPPEALVGAVQTALRRLAPGRDREHLGAAFLACEELVRARPQTFSQALRAGTLTEALLPTVRDAVRADASRGGPERLRGGWMGLYVGADGRPVQPVAANADASRTRDAAAERYSAEAACVRDGALDTTRRALERAFSLAREEGNRTLLRYLGWYRERLGHTSYQAIAERAGAPAATIRTGVARARKRVLALVHELQQAQPAPLSGEAPAELEPLRRHWEEQRLDALEAGLDHTRGVHATDPHWLNLAGLLAAQRGRTAQAVEHYHTALIHADAPSVRGRVLNNLANLADDAGDADEAQRCWLRARQLVPHAPAPLVNLLALASHRRDYAAAQHHLAELADLMSCGRLSSRERAYVLRRLREHPRLHWLRRTDAWRKGPARWLRKRRAVRRALVAGGAVVALVGGLLASVALGGRALPLLTGVASAHAAEPSVSQLETSLLVARGGDSMGKSQPKGRGSRRG